MKTIKQRAEEYAWIGDQYDLRGAYTKGAEEQRKIDVEKLRHLLRELGVFEWLANDPPEGFSANVIEQQVIDYMMEE
ncbi:MAG: hypothetical protein ACI4TM_06740 [Candidatus Cryptobacteroides sp.]